MSPWCCSVSRCYCSVSSCCCSVSRCYCSVDSWCCSVSRCYCSVSSCFCSLSRCCCSVSSCCCSVSSCCCSVSSCCCSGCDVSPSAVQPLRKRCLRSFLPPQSVACVRRRAVVRSRLRVSVGSRCWADGCQRR